MTDNDDFLDFIRQHHTNSTLMLQIYQMHGATCLRKIELSIDSISTVICQIKSPGERNLL